MTEGTRQWVAINLASVIRSYFFSHGSRNRKKMDKKIMDAASTLTDEFFRISK